MGAIRVSVAGTMLIVAFLAVDYAVLSALKEVPTLVVRVAFLGALPMANVAAACFALAVSRLARRGEVGLPLVAFALVGGAAILALLAVVNLAPQFFYDYLDLIVGFSGRPRQSVVELHRFGGAWAGWLAILLVYVAVTPPLLVPALLGGWMTRGHRLRLVMRSEGLATPVDDPGRPGTRP